MKEKDMVSEVIYEREEDLKKEVLEELKVKLIIKMIWSDNESLC